ncbi:MAG: NAD-dependent epimerase/dehydratase family protein [Acidimicrobiales bacterium]
MTTVALTGASGFLGRHLGEALRAAGHEVRALHRRPTDSGPGVEVVVGDLSDTGALTRLVEGADAVVHAAALVRSADAGALQRVNVDGTCALLAVCDDVPRFLQISTAGVHGRPGGKVTEASRIDPPNAYERSKVAADLEVARRRPERSTLVRPTNVVGVGHPQDPLLRFLGRVAAGRLWAPAAGRTNYVSAAAVADVVVRLVAWSEPPPVLLVNEGASVLSLAGAGASALGVPDRARQVPGLVARPVGAVLRAGAARMFALHRASMLFDTTDVQTSGPEGLRTPPDALRQTLDEMVADYRGRGLL